MRSTPAAAAASTTVVCSRTRSASSLAETKNSVCTPAKARRIASPSAYSALARSAPRSGARLGSRRTKRRSAPCVVSDRATRPPIAPVAPVTAISVMPVATTCGRRLFRSGDWLAQQVTEALQDRKPDVLELDVAGGMRLLDVEAHDGAVISRAHLPGEVRARPAAVLDRDGQPVRRVGVQDLPGDGADRGGLPLDGRTGRPAGAGAEPVQVPRCRLRAGEQPPHPLRGGGRQQPEGLRLHRVPGHGTRLPP